MEHLPTPSELAAQHDLAGLADTTHQLGVRLMFARRGVLGLTDDDRADAALWCIAHATALAERARTDRWRWVLDALDAGAHLPAIAEAGALAVDDVDAGARVWLDRALAAGDITAEFHAAALRVLDEELDALPGEAEDR